jgi:hypothetical protein
MQYVNHTASDNHMLELEELQKLMEEMAGTPREKHGERTPGERCMYEIQRREIAQDMGILPRDTERLPV